MTDALNIQSISGGMTNPGTAAAGGGARAGKVSMQDFHFTRTYDRVSPTLMQHCASGKHIPDAVITLRKSGDKAQVFYKVTLSDVMVTSYQLSGADALPMEAFSLNFAKVDWEYYSQDQKGQLSLAGKGSWDLKTNTGSVSGGTKAGTLGGATGPLRLPILNTTRPTGFFSGGARPRGLSSPAIFAKAAGIEGEAAQQGHEREIEIASFQMGMANQGTAAFGGGGGAGKVTFQDISIAKMLDKASSGLMLACASGKHIPQITITFVRRGEKPQDYLTVTLSDVLISGYSTSAGGDVPMESLSLNFTKVEFKNVGMGPTGQTAPGGVFTYDLKSAP
jgi:type VI secretion system secreted protein Hcp